MITDFINLITKNLADEHLCGIIHSKKPHQGIDFKRLVLLIALGTSCAISAQETKKAMTFDELAGWKRITGQVISDNGKWVSCKMEPWRGDASIFLYNDKGEMTASFHPAAKGEFSASSNYLLVTKKPELETIEALKLKKAKEEEMPKDELVIFKLTGEKESIDSLKSYKLSESADWIAYQRDCKSDTVLHVRSLDGNKEVKFADVKEYGFAKKKNRLYYTTDSCLCTYTPENGLVVLFEGKGILKKATFNEEGTKLAFLYCPDKDSTATGFSLYLAENEASARLIADKGQTFLPENWVISENGAVSFSDNSERLFFGTAPTPKQKDTTVLAENRPDVQIWKWDEGIQYTQQVYNKEKDLKKTYTAVYNIGSNKLFQLADTAIPTLLTADGGNAALALLSTSQPYDTEQMWEGRTRYDIYTVNLETGERSLIKKAADTNMQLSPKGMYAYWYCQQDSSWYTRSMNDDKEYRLTTPVSFAAWDEENDVPDYPSPHGLAGWTADDRKLLIYDRYDIWKFDPTSANAPVNLTVNGRKDRLSYRLIRLDKEKKFIDLKELQLLSAFNEKTKGSGYYSARLTSPAVPKTLLAGNFMLRTPIKAKDSDAVIYTSETFEQYPDIRLSDLSFKKSIQLTHGGEQQAELNWGTAELVSWISLDGIPLEGVVYKPENFDPNKKYPVIVNFYERNAETLYAYHMPEPHRSTIDYHFYTSNGYIIFNPDVRYTTGYPGESCFNCVMPGITSLIAKGYVNEKAIGAQGHSWGGYQVAYLATRTHLFAAIESGAPVVNMFSAYGGIRWGSGLNRSFQYEHGQSRIGGTLWDSPLQYMENSPLFTMDKVETPILIMHNDNDGHVPWYQGIEYFVALKRLQKPVWLLNYTGEVHWPMRLANRIDFQKRMFQFFQHYLDNQPMPKWMSEGVPAVDQPFELGY